jgi:DNA-binding GntR family transcriptional regulator
MEVEHAVQVLRKDIHEGRFVPGQRLVESDLMTYLEVTRGRVREVFRRLEAEGLIEISKNRGASVRKISREEVANIAEVLEDISVLIIKKAAKRIDENDNRKMLATSMETAREFREKSTNVMEVAAFMDENARFWGSSFGHSQEAAVVAVPLRHAGCDHSRRSGQVDQLARGHYCRPP